MNNHLTVLLDVTKYELFSSQQVLDVYLVLLELSINQQWGLFVHFLSDSMSHSIVGLQASIETCVTVLIVYILLGVSGGSSGGERWKKYSETFCVDEKQQLKTRDWENEDREQG